MSAQNIPTKDRDEFFKKMKQSPENTRCFDCNAKNPLWASIKFGTLICMDCAAKHREFGAVITLVRSLNLDGWNQRQISFLEEGGNDKLRVFARQNGLSGNFDYKGALAKRYKDLLEALVNKKQGQCGNAQVKAETKEKSEFDELNEKPKEEVKEEKEAKEEKADDGASSQPATKAIVQKKQFNVTFNT